MKNKLQMLAVIDDIEKVIEENYGDQLEDCILNDQEHVLMTLEVMLDNLRSMIEKS